MSPPHIYSTSPLALWWSLIRSYGGVQPRCWGKFATILATSALTTPLRLVERMRYGRQVSSTEIRRPPIFILGFARTGTTHLHNLMAHDPNLGYVSTLHAMSAPFFLISRGWLESLIAGRIPSKRPMDNVAVSLSFPQEEELAVAAMSKYSSVHQLSFPGQAREIVAKMGNMRLSESEMEGWINVYLHVLRKATFASDGRQLVLKTPANLGRAALLRQLFPDAKFVFLIRNPYVVFCSTIKLYRTMIPMYQLQDVDWDEIEASLLDNYVDMTRLYMRDRESIPEGNLIEVRFEEIESDAMGVLSRIYSSLDLPNWEQAQQPISDYLATLTGYRQNRYQFDQSLLDKVHRAWGFAEQEWGYEPPDLSD